MNLIRCSNKTAALLCVVALLATAGTASAFSVSADGVPSETAVDEEVSVTYTIDDPFTDAPNEWTLSGSTELQNVSWTVTVLRAGDQVDQETYGDQSFEQDLNIDNNGDQVRIELVGTTPAVSNYTYDPAQSYQVASLSRISGNNEDEFRNDTAHHYTEESQATRQAIDDAQAAIDEAGGNEEAEELINSAISSYENENFQNAQDLAGQAQSQAEQAQQSAQTQRTLLMAGGALVVLLLLVGGGYYAYTQMGGDDYSKL
ncbi:hypothetical protein Harman_11130 [Haloarcula mannanilytica]|uniref:Uncharacterized protein n=1 Tax=Haloarcula mannanilytica TaxID=2509225 RepID=A0A4C2EFC2_9EURY|nr:hypothetical protein [Haloarcula mannanilytica]GCF13178.1 hypothetical protein Harman_11130 [Haloarcula mannanilytica]